MWKTILFLVVAFASGCAFKAAWIGVWQWSRADWLVTAMTWDPFPLQFAYLCAEQFFDHRGIAPSDADIRWFDVFLIVGSGLQWTLAGLATRFLWMRRRSMVPS